MFRYFFVKSLTPQKLQKLSMALMIVSSIGLQAEAVKTSPDATDVKQFTGTIERYSKDLNSLIANDAVINVLASGFEWSEGPVWINDAKAPYLLLSDVPQNKIFKWNEKTGLMVFMFPSGFEGAGGEHLREAGSNGLIRFDNASIIAADHGRRSLSKINLSDQNKTTLVAHYQGNAFNSPNDLVMSKNGQLFFTDPPYGLKGLNQSPHKVLDFNGVYRVDIDGQVTAIDKDLSFPNGIGLSPDERTLYVANSDPESPLWKKYSLDESGVVLSTEIFYDASAAVAAGKAGLPDGMAVDQRGNIFASGPGGIYIFNSKGLLLGMIKLDRSASNCSFGGVGGSTLFITADDLLLSIETNTHGLP
ncbi:SMP-30/gluconolactonase/LRE family protein [Oceanicoccus sp. KOV_DT_Chl]|uniref:SMP-30/gluconolactonase/LRE family protein n=1 Tax=Oceanicoccus sp. KOV_DT_Chl TaxID=1904639 RepID=UPI00190EF684|nr:SMP-30/gluconolactonase/LRE family protein [Oceanicoccus sp. KOV_DT_Chl]